ncbi:uncharacterized protein FOMMEDRAFT_140336 [Fomitiporia mediterranea MF3/22]|uniref:uncharacterized protein n=1 Tax=Fomitiporia mediterranea (strain MF3/22) TaxID=694068 RepID=UPI000440890C|nr:uncharacterized protein FOMMEDRAFT_140336 [Fomitiporia mediterranea MF3/22]EJD04352.1 hypothetical protein FOMMEDRAFT_140336 [Fomitiporia mediterranea MF3/22]
MPLNVPGLLAPFQLLFRPYLVLPSVVIKDLRCLDFCALHRAGYRGAVIDKDNCLTLPYEDKLVPELNVAWEECKNVFGAENILIVSNSAGTYLDPGGIEAESVSFHLGVPVLRHNTLKPGYACISAIRAYFASLPTPVPDNALVIVGDRIFTDVVLANRIRPYNLIGKRAPSATFEKTELNKPDNGPNGPLSVFVENVWRKDSTAMRFLEKKVVDLVQRWNRVEENEVHKSLFVRN